MTAQYSGPERRRIPRDARHSFGTVFLRTGDSWLAREMLVLDETAEAFRIRTLPNLREHEFLVQRDREPEVRRATIQRSEQRGDYWEFTLTPGSPVAHEALGQVDYDFPRVLA